MSTGHVKNETTAVKILRHAIARYAEQVRDATARSRHEVAAVERSARDEVESRRAQLRRREAAVESARAALRSGDSKDDRLRAAVDLAERARADAAASLDRAKRAATLVASTQADLARAVHHADQVVGQHSSVASSALASLESRLTEITAPAHAGFTQGLAVGAAVLLKAATSTPDLGPVAGDFAAALGHENRWQHSSITELRDDVTGQEVGLWAGGQLEETKRQYGDPKGASS